MLIGLFVFLLVWLGPALALITYLLAVAARSAWIARR